MKKFVFVNGEFLPSAEACVSIFDSGFQYGDGVFETFRAYNGKVFKLEEHLKRMQRSAKALNIPVSLPPDKARAIIKRLCKLNSQPNCVIRFVATRGLGVMWKSSRAPVPTVAAMTRDIHMNTEILRKTGVKAVFAGAARDTGNPLYSHKTLNYLPNVLERNKALSSGAFEAVFMDPQKRVLEGTISNIFAVKHGKVFTPPLSLNILPGITRKTVMEICRILRTVCKEEPFGMDALLSADEIFFTNSVFGVMPVRKIGQKIFPGKMPGRLTNLISEVYLIELAKKLRLENEIFTV